MTIRNSLSAFGMLALICCAGCSGGRDDQAEARSQNLPLPETHSQWTDYDRPAEYTATASSDAFVEMRDGVSLALHIIRPADDSGNPVSEPLPVILTVTGYNSSLSSYALNANSLVARGYVHVYVDERGTGSSEGSWESFGAAAQDDYLEVLNWIDAQPWSNGHVGTWGPSYMGLSQFFVAKHQHPSHKAMFAIVPMADAYRDIVFTGGQTNAGFIPLWVGLVGGLGLFPAAALQNNPADALSIFLEHLSGSFLQFGAGTIADALLGGATVYDSEFWRIRSPIEYTANISIPTFVVGGLNDLFQRGEPMLYEAMKTRAESKLVIGPWTHLGGSTGEGLPADNVPSIDQMALQWFDRYLRGDRNGVESQPAVTQYLYGAERWVTAPDWPHPAARARVLHLQPDGGLADDEGATGTVLVPQVPANGVCSMSASQWTAGIIGMLPLPCATDNRLNELLLEATFTTAPLEEPLYVNGPMQANVWVSTTALDAGLVVRVTDVYPDGRSQELTNGLLTASMRAVNPDKSRYLDGEMIQPWHPFTEETKAAPAPGEIVELNVEIFPSSFVIAAGHSLRVTVGASDLPHGLPPLPDLVNQAVGMLTVYTGGETASNIVIPVIDELPAAP